MTFVLEIQCGGHAWCTTHWFLGKGTATAGAVSHCAVHCHMQRNDLNGTIFSAIHSNFAPGAKHNEALRRTAAHLRPSHQIAFSAHRRECYHLGSYHRFYCYSSRLTYTAFDPSAVLLHSDRTQRRRRFEDVLFKPWKLRTPLLQSKYSSRTQCTLLFSHLSSARSAFSRT